MKKYIITTITLVCLATGLLAQTICCPDFSLKFNRNKSCRGDYVQCDPKIECTAYMCKYSTNTFLVVPNLPGYSYSWVISGGIPSSTDTNPINITWGGGCMGTITVIITSNTDVNCVKILKENICLLDAPDALFESSFNNVCAGSPITFTNTSIGGTHVSWDFGDGTFAGNVNSPVHSYEAAGTYTVTITVCNDTDKVPCNPAGPIATGGGDNPRPCCGCCSTYSAPVTVNAGTPLTILPNDCNLCLCPGDIAEYCANITCGTYNWTVSGGSIISGMGTNCVKVQWSGPHPTSLTLNAPGCGNACGDTTTLIVPVLVSSIPIMPDNPIVCQNSVQSYYLPSMPGVAYTWTVVNGSIVGPSINTSSIVVSWGSGTSGPGLVKCTYSNMLSPDSCTGTSTLQVYFKPELTINGPSQICSGSTSTTTYSVGGGFANWSISAPAGYTGSTTFNNVSGINVNLNVTGNYTITAVPVMATSYCTTSSIYNVVVNPTPVLNPIVGDITICPNQLFNYSVSSNASGGDFGWNIIPAVTSLTPYGEHNTFASVIFPGTGTSWTLKATQTVNGCFGFISQLINKTIAPTLPVNPITTCIGGQTTVIVASGTGPFTWSTSPGASLINGQGTNQATYEIHSNSLITVSNCGGASNPLNVNVTSPPNLTISVTGTLCAGNLVLTAPTGTGYTYQWLGGSTTTTQFINVTNPGTYTVQVTMPGGCTAVASYTVAPEAIPTVSISTGDPLNWCGITPNVLFQAFTLSVGCNFQWYKNGSPVGTNSGTYTATSAGNYYVKVTCGGCMATSNTISVSYSTPPCGNPCSTVPPPPNPLGTITVSGCNPVNFNIGVTGCTDGSVIWNFGDGQTGLGTNTTHSYSDAGVYLVSASIICSGCTFTVYSNAAVPLIADFNYSVQCGSNGSNIVTLQNTSQTLGGWNVSSVNWSSTCGTLSNATGNNSVLNTSSGCSPSVTMTITVINPSNGQTCTASETHAFNFPTLQLSIIPPLLTSVCQNQTYQFTSSMTTGILQYRWYVNSVLVSQNSILDYSFNGSPPNPEITLSVTDQNGCVFTASKTVTILTPDPLSIIGPPSICPDCPPTSSLSIVNPSNFNTYQWVHNGTIIPGATGQNYQLCTFNVSGNYYATAIDNNTGCTVTSATIQVAYYPKPLAHIVGQAVQCIDSTSNVSFNLQNSNCLPNYSYSWTVNQPGTSFGTDNLQCSVNITVNNVLLSIPYQFILTVTDNGTLCSAKDTLCMYFYKRPAVTIQPSGPFCEGTLVVFNATPNPLTAPPAGYNYLWSNGATINPITASVPSVYYTYLTDLNSGCSSASNQVQINKVPDVRLFPACCDTICDTLCSSIVLDPLLPANSLPPSGYSIYNVVWQDLYNGNTVSYPGPNFPLSSIANQYGHHSINIVVNFTNDTSCISTSGTYDLYIKPCNTCNCKNSHFINLSWNSIDNPVDAVKFNCGQRMGEINCNHPVAFNAGFLCDPPSCNQVVTYSLFNNGSISQSGNMPFTTSGLTAGFYTLEMYGRCNDIICDTCVITFQIVCDQTPCCPQMNQISIRNSNENLSQQSYQGHDYSLYTTQVSIVGGNTPYTEVRATVVDFELTANYGNCIDCANLPFTWASLSATTLAGITPVTTLPSSVTGYVVPSNIYGNPREVVWNNNNALIDLSSAQSTNLSFYLPPESEIPCCMLKAKICVKYSFYDINCNLCEIDTCYEVFIGDTTVQESCCCVKWSNEPVRIIRKSTPETKIRPSFVNCGENINLSAGEYTITAPAFICSPATCNATYQWVISRKSWELGNHPNVSGTSNSFTYNFDTPGQYLVTFTPQCGSCKCEPCRIIVNIEGTGNSCKCDKWITHTISIQWKKPEIQNGTIKCPSDKPFEIPFLCAGTTVKGNFCQYSCSPANCQLTYNWRVTGPGGNLVASGANSTTTEYSFVPVNPGNYTLYISPVCNGIECDDKCVVEIYVKEIKPCK
jgi:hypothetical protein